MFWCRTVLPPSQNLGWELRKKKELHCGVGEPGHAWAFIGGNVPGSVSWVFHQWKPVVEDGACKFPSLGHFQGTHSSYWTAADGSCINMKSRALQFTSASELLSPLRVESGKHPNLKQICGIQLIFEKFPCLNPCPPWCCSTMFHVVPRCSLCNLASPQHAAHPVRTCAASWGNTAPARAETSQSLDYGWLGLRNGVSVVFWFGGVVASDGFWQIDLGWFWYHYQCWLAEIAGNG